MLTHSHSVDSWWKLEVCFMFPRCKLHNYLQFIACFVINVASCTFSALELSCLFKTDVAFSVLSTTALSLYTMLICIVVVLLLLVMLVLSYSLV